MVKICKFDHLIACSDYFAQFLLLKRAFSIKYVMLKNSHTLRYAFHVNDDIILTLCKHRCKQVSAAILNQTSKLLYQFAIFTKIFCRMTAQTMRTFTHKFTIFRT